MGDQDVDPAELDRELELVGRDRRDISLLAVVSARLLDSDRPGDDRSFCKGTADEIVDDLASLAERGFSHIVVHLDCRSRTMAEYFDQGARLAEEVAPRVREFVPTGGWAADV